MENVEQCCVCFWRSSSNLFSFLAPIDVHTTYMNIIYAKTGKLTVSCCSSHSCDWITVVILSDIEKFYLIFQYLCNICSSHSDFWNNNCQLFQTYDKSLVLVSVSVCLWIYDKVNIWSRKELPHYSWTMWTWIIDFFLPLKLAQFTSSFSLGTRW